MLKHSASACKCRDASACRALHTGERGSTHTGPSMGQGSQALHPFLCAQPQCTEAASEAAWVTADNTRGLACLTCAAACLLGLHQHAGQHPVGGSNPHHSCNSARSSSASPAHGIDSISEGCCTAGLHSPAAQEEGEVTLHPGGPVQGCQSPQSGLAAVGRLLCLLQHHLQAQSGCSCACGMVLCPVLLCPKVG